MTVDQISETMTPNEASSFFLGYLLTAKNAMTNTKGIKDPFIKAGLEQVLRLTGYGVQNMVRLFFACHLPSQDCQPASCSGSPATYG